MPTKKTMHRGLSPTLLPSLLRSPKHLVQAIYIKEGVFGGVQPYALSKLRHHLGGKGCEGGSERMQTAADAWQRKQRGREGARQSARSRGAKSSQKPVLMGSKCWLELNVVRGETACKVHVKATAGAAH
jgi:hypothetical protein